MFYKAALMFTRCGELQFKAWPVFYKGCAEIQADTQISLQKNEYDNIPQRSRLI